MTPEDRSQLRERVQRLLLVDADVSVNSAERRTGVFRRVSDILDREAKALAPEERSSLEREITDAVVGLGPIEPLLRDRTISEIMVNGPSDVYVERAGRIERTAIDLGTSETVLHLIDRVVGPPGLRVDASRPWVDARLPDGSRVHAIIPPLALGGPVLTIRKFSREPYEMHHLVESGVLSGDAAAFLESCVRAKINIVVSGGAGAGKTTMLNALSGFVPDGERIVTIEDAAELRLQQPHVVALETRPDNVEGAGAVGMRELVRNALRMRPDRLVIGEVRGAEAIDMLQAMNTGHRGSMSTVHANSPADLIVRLEGMILGAGIALPLQTVRAQIASGLDLIVHVERMGETRRVVEIADVSGDFDSSVRVVTLVRWRGDDHVPTGALPHFVARLREAGESRPIVFDRVVHA